MRTKPSPDHLLPKWSDMNQSRTTRLPLKQGSRIGDRENSDISPSAVKPEPLRKEDNPQ